MRFMNRQSRGRGLPRTIVAILFFLTLTSLGCGKGDADTVIAEPQFEAEGVLAFRKPSGETIVTIAIELAETQAEHQMGLMNRRSLPARGGMLFLSESEREREFWMKNTPLPLDILFIRSDSSIANIVKRTTPLSPDLIKSVGVVQHVLEVRAGFTDRYGIDSTHTISWQRREDVEKSPSE